MNNLRRGVSTSCGCRKNEVASAKMTRHWAAHGHGHRFTRTYKTWDGIIQRCTNAKDKSWSDYGGRGIGVCGRWLEFRNFLADMGERPAGLSIDRIDNSRGYEPSNCRWATASEQNRNRRPFAEWRKP